MTSPFEKARSQGYSDAEIMQYLSNNPQYSEKIGRAKQQGYSDEEISSFLSNQFSNQESPPERAENPQRSILAKGGRIAGQFGLGMAENALLPYEAAVAPLASKDAQNAAYRETLSEDLERLMEQKASGVWDEKDQELYDSIVEQIKDPRKSEEFTQTANIGVRGLAEKATGLDLHPEGILEKGASWAGFIKNPKNIVNLAKTGLKPSQLIKAITPTGSEALRGLGAGAALEIAEDGEYGPIGTMAAAIVGDLLGGGAAGLAKGAKDLITKPKQTIAKGAAKFTPADKLKLQKEIIQDFRNSGIQADVGTLTNSDLIKFAQSRLAQSGLTGRALDDLKDQLTSQIKNEYKAVADSLGEARFSTLHEAGETIANSMKSIRDADLSATRQLYKNATQSLKEKASVDSKKLAAVIEKVESDLRPGSIKSTEQQTVLNTIQKIKRDLYDSSDTLMYANVKDLMNNKIALNDIINYEVQGGSKQLLKGIVAELDRAIISHGKENPSFAKNYINANRKFSEHAKTFRNKSIDKVLRGTDPSQLMNKMNTIQGIRDIGNVLGKTPEGKETFNNFKRLKLDNVVGDHLVDSTTQQVKLGTFSKLLEKGKNREIIQEILGPQAFKRLERLQKNTGKLADTAQKFYNSSKSGVTIEDVGIVSKALTDMAHLFSGNIWPIIRTTGGLVGARYLTRLIANPEFLKLVEEAVLAGEKNNISKMLEIGERMSGPIKGAMVQSKNEDFLDEE